MATSYNNLAVLYSDTQRFQDSEAMYKSALTIYERLAKANPQAYEPDLATSYNNLAVLYSD
ncbi:tetratricopeptide repeat protein, partial [Prevotella dentalis]|uniref:tetratricopeptide repeat protein n=1 Tax=Prevotella dentalis TaxID=52227 RepID=UPI003C6E5184